MEGKVWVGATEASNQVVLERANGPFSSVAAVDSRRCELEIDCFVGHEFFKDGGAFIVEAVELGAKACGN